MVDRGDPGARGEVVVPLLNEDADERVAPGGEPGSSIRSAMSGARLRGGDVDVESSLAASVWTTAP